MIIGCPKEIKAQEGRVGLTPAGVDDLVRAGHTVYIEKDAGLCSGFTDEEYKAVGAEILPSAKDVYGIADMSRVIFSTLLGIVFLHESLTFRGAISLFLVAAGLYFANQKKDIDNGEYQYKYIIYVFLSCFFNAISGTLDKYIMSTGEITSSALQFWFMLLISVFYLSYMLIKKEKLELKKVFTNPWVYLLSFSLVFGDRLLFIANQDPAAKVTIMTVLKQSSAVVTILLGKLLYKEKNIARKLACALVIICGIALSVIT
jgi:drug/metabolite transporter (DMT)-like permease